MNKLLTPFAVLLVLIAPNIACAMHQVEGVPDAPPAPSAEELEQQRTLQQRDAPIINAPAPEEQPPVTIDQYPAQGNADAGAFGSAVEVHTTQVEQQRALQAASTQRSAPRKTGTVLIFTAVAGILGLGLGRLGINLLSRTSREEASRAIAEALAKEEDGVSYGGEHRHYVIPADKDDRP